MTTPALHIHEPRADVSASGRAYRAIRELIVTLELPPGSVVSERELMDRLGLGRTPIREALRDLARERLVEVYPRRGMFVSGVDVGDMAGLSEVRLVIEGMAARLAAERRNAADLREIEALLEEIVRTPPDAGESVAGASTGSSGGIPLARIPLASKGQRERSLIELDQRLHRHVYRCTHNEFLATTLEEYYVLTLRIWFLALDRVERLDSAVREHRALLEAIRDGDADKAEGVMHAHIRGFERAIRAVL